MEEKKKYKTSSESKMKWEKENYKKYVVRFRTDRDKELMEYINKEKERGVGTTELFRDALTEYIENNQWK
jgi:hypothetical protein